MENPFSPTTKCEERTSQLAYKKVEHWSKENETILAIQFVFGVTQPRQKIVKPLKLKGGDPEVVRQNLFCFILFYFFFYVCFPVS